MTESDYILVTNLAKVRVAIHVIRETMTDTAGAITKETQSELYSKLYDIEQKLYRAIDVVGE